MAKTKAVKLNKEVQFFHYINPLTNGIISVKKTDKIKTASQGLTKAKAMITEGGHK